MDNQDQRRIETAGHDSHAVHLCHKCGWPFPNPHPSAKHRRAHKKICGTIEGYKLSVSEGQHNLNGSDDEHVSDDDHKTPGLVLSVSNSLETGNNEKGSAGNGEKFIRSEDEVFSDAVADFSDSGSNPDIKERLQDSLDAGADMEMVDIKGPKFSGISKDKDLNAADMSPLIDKSTNDSQTQNPNILQNESFGVGNTVGLQGQLSGPIVDPLSGSTADLRTEESATVDSEVFLGFSSDSPPGKAEAMPDILSVKNIYAVENVTDCSLMSATKKTNLEGKNEINSAGDVVEIEESSAYIVGETCEALSNMIVSDVVREEHQAGDGAVRVEEKNGAVSNYNRDTVEIVEPSDSVGKMSEEVSKIVVSDEVSVDHQVGDEAVNLEEKNEAESVSLLSPDSLPLKLNSTVITDDSQVESAYVVQFATSNDDKILPANGEGNANVDLLPTCNDKPDDGAHSQSAYEDFKDHKGVAYQNPFLHSSESLKYEGDDINDRVTKENKFHNISQLSEKSEVISLNIDVIGSSMGMESLNSEPTSKEMHAEDYTDVSTVKLTVESYQTQDEIVPSMNAMKTKENESHMIHFSEVHGTDDAGKNYAQKSLPEGSLMGPSNENQREVSFGSAISETVSVINVIDSPNHHVASDGKVIRATGEDAIEIILKDLQPDDILQSEDKLSEDLFEHDGADKSNAANELGENVQGHVLHAQYKESPIVADTSLPKSATNHFESPIISESSDMVLDRPVNKSSGTKCRDISPLLGAQRDTKEDEINVNIKLNEEYNKSVDTSTESHHAQDAGLLVKAAEDLARKYTSPLTAEPDSEDNPDGEPCKEVPGISVVPVQDQTNNLFKHGSSRVDASVDSGSRCDSLEGNWGSVSVLSMQSDAPAVIDAETLSSTGLLALTEAGKPNLNNSKAAPERQQSDQSEMFEPPSFMTLVEPMQVSPKATASEVQRGQNPQQSDSTSQAGWFPTINQVVGESQERKRNEEIIAKVTNWSTSKEHTPLKSLLGEAAHSNKPKSPKSVENSGAEKTSKVSEKNGSGLTTVNSILGPESPAAQVVKGEVAKEWNSPARYPADIKREKRKVKSRPYWIQLVCCTSVGPQRR
ncbi:uncharacterized protein HKW66_Vig0002540 [Vigna angularis]|uniref:C2H2-type domain-containing protein n=2 Tax=Phaseolus angularis TaxID=3914 RepID=A0A8T0LBR0_PHAAN|nr:uncharacterized protein LOC108327251 isoform X1 [Vigna angularis]KAG2409589.1 uncharacterized protein HKW66_Vig0002540 [Vigna angularis]BAT74426.1 hypothetical protein VIGAN_01209400 [Vigna angularis var. angularis]